MWDGDAGKVPNAIIDDEIGVWLKAIQAKKAFVWIIFDSCHSGTMIRGIKEQERQISAQNDLKVPADVIRQAEQRAAKRAKEGTRGGAGGPQRAPLPQGGIVATYACQSNEVTVERELPLRSPDAKPYGLLTFTIAQILTQAQQNTGKPPTYSELHQLVNSRYSAMGRNAPSPQVEGGNEDRSREVLGAKAWPGRSSIILTQQTKGWKINAGSLHGITPGSVLAVRPLADKKDASKVLGHVRVENVKMTSAVVAPCAFGAVKLQPSLPEEARCEMVHVDFGVQRLRIALDPLQDDKKTIDPAEAKSIAKIIDAAVEKTNTLLQYVPSVDAADWIVRRGKGGVFLLPAAEYSQRIGTNKESRHFGPYAVDEKLSAELADRFLRIVRAENFKKLVGATEGETSRGKSEGSVQVDLKLERFPAKNEADPPKDRTLPIDVGRVRLYDNDVVGVSVHNPNRFAIDVTILYIDSGFGIEAYFPDPSRGEINRIKAGETVVIPPIRMDASSTSGLENLIVVAIKASTKDRVDLSFMAQPTLEKAMATRGDAPKTTLEALLETNIYGAGTTRGIARRAVDDFAFRVIPWHLSPQPRPKEK